MDPHTLANLFKRSNYDKLIVSEFNSLDYLYEVLLEIYESENCDEVLNKKIYKVIYDCSLIEKHDCNDFTINSINVNCANNMQNPKLGDANFVMLLLIAKIFIGVIMFLMILKIYLSHTMNMFAIILKVGLEECQL